MLLQLADTEPNKLSAFYPAPTPTLTAMPRTAKITSAWRSEGIANRLKNDYSQYPDMWQKNTANCYQNNVAWL
ncbi:hypothetical protein [Symbiopectobacterium sp. RP]|uniref:hypothetical protein n=1 Tax=Symbiopectobacterium sp. RP TaxID=3248553 RepID=UPI003D2DEDEB